MNRAEYIKELKKCLDVLSKEDIADAVEYCNQYFDEAGMSNEEKAIKELGTPRQFANNLIANIKNINEDESISLEAKNKGISIIKDILFAKNTVNKNYEITENINEVHIEANAMQFEIRESKGLKNIEIAVNNFFNEDDIKYSVDNNKLFIRSLDKKEFLYTKAILKHPNIILVIPEGMKFNKFEIKSNASSVKLFSITTENLKVSNDAGLVTFSGICSDTLSVKNNVGQVEIKLKENSKNVSLINNKGTLNITTCDINVYRFNFKNSHGMLKIGGKLYTDMQNWNSEERKNNIINIDNTAGMMSIS